MKQFIFVITIVCAAVLIIPTVVVLLVSEPEQAVEVATEKMDVQNVSDEPEFTIPVFRSQREQVESIPLEQYVAGVVASEMPAQFEIEALKAQALTARTYIIRHLLHPGDIELPEGALVTDTVTHQVYHNDEELQGLWGKDFDWKMKKINEAVRQTRGQVLTFEGEPITASFFSTSNGYTENSEDYWQNEIPYLRSVESPWDEKSPRFISSKTIPIAQFQEKLGVTLSDDGSPGQIIERTDGGRVAKVKINEKELSGRKVRDLLELDSSDFNWERKGDQVVIETKGWGHGVGMSQYGAQGMAQDGRTYDEIVSHYYQGVNIQQVEPYVAKLTAKQE